MRLAALLCLLPALALADPVPFAAFEKASAPFLNDPHDVEMGPDGMLYVADKFGDRIVVVDPDTLEELWSFDHVVRGAHDISFGPDGTAYVSSTGTSSVDVFAIEGEKATHLRQMTGFSRTEGVLAHSNGRIYVMASGTGQLFMVEGDAVLGVYQAGPGAHDVDEGPDGSIWIADTFARQLIQISPELEFRQVLRGEAYGFVGPRYLDVDGFGRIIVADQDAHRVLMIDGESGDVLGVIGDSAPGEGPYKFDDPEGVLAVGAEYFFADSDNNRLVKYSVVTN